MLFKKMIREIGKNIGQFLSIFILSFLAISLFACMKASNISAYNKLDDLYKRTNNANGWVYSEGFSEGQLESIKALPDIKDAELRTHITANAKDNDQAQLEVYILDENIVSKPLITEGEDFDVEKTDSVWISESFANAWNIKIGDKFSMMYQGMCVEKTVAGLIVSPEYQYLKADKDLDIVFKNISVVYISARDYPGIPKTELVFTTDKKDVKGMEQEISDALSGDYAVFCDRNDLPGIKVMMDELNQHDQFAVTFPIVFIAIALLVIMTTMNRMIDKQRVQIGTLRAMGMKKRKITFHYLSYSFFVSLLGSITGVFVGTYCFGELVAKIFRDWYQIPGWTVEMDASFIIVTAIIVFCCTGATYFSCRKVMNVHPAESLRPAPPKSGKNTIFEKLPFWNKLGFSSQYNLRDISRGKLRAFMGVFGTAAGMLLMVAAFASYRTIKDASSWTFDKLQNYKAEVDFSGGTDISEAEAIRSKFDGEIVQAQSVEIAAKKNAMADDRRSTTMMVIEGRGNFALTDVNQDITELPPGTIAITQKLAKALDVEVGDVIYWHIYEKNTWYEMKVGLINRNPNLQGVTMLREDYEALGIDFVPSILYTDENVTYDEVKKVSDSVLAVHDDTDLRESFDIMMSMINAMIGVFIAFALILPIVVLYNCGNLSFNERVKEFATLKVLGFSTTRIRKLLALQNFWLSVIGLFIGAPFGTILLQYMFDSNGDSMDYQVGADILTYIISGAAVLVTAVLVSFMFNKRIKKLDMVEILKGME
ncbi:MAG: ABC transporter permease [Lachnospiraceae bacterium]|nr:ABC transporter permease [Lachnospiraceae bacterium]